MTKQIGKVQEKHLEELREVGGELAQIRSREKEVMAQVHKLVVKGFTKNISGIELHKASGLSLPRIYQLQKEHQ